MKSHIAALFDVGLLTLRRITWDAPAALLEKLIAYEAVHAIESWDELKHRLDSDRRCYAFFHPAMPNEPLVFVEIALTTGITTDLATLLDARAPEVELDAVETAVFYSISNCQPGLAGVNLGTALIKQVVEALRRDLPQLDRFVTLSPIPGFRAWLAEEFAGAAIGLSDAERELLPAPPARVLARLASSDWETDEAIKPALLALCARYLTSAVNNRALDPVANFHLANGAGVERIDWMADPSPTGMARSFGSMANYLYEDALIPVRAEAYAPARARFPVRGGGQRAARDLRYAVGRGTRPAGRRCVAPGGRLLFRPERHHRVFAAERGLQEQAGTLEQLGRERRDRCRCPGRSPSPDPSRE